jgi:hypothetical protein
MMSPFELAHPNTAFLRVYAETGVLSQKSQIFGENEG